MKHSNKVKITIIYGNDKDLKLVGIISKKIKRRVKNTNVKVDVVVNKCTQKNDREIFIQATALTALNLQIGVCYSLLLALYTRMFDCDCGFSSFREKIKLDSIVLER